MKWASFPYKPLPGGWNGCQAERHAGSMIEATHACMVFDFGDEPVVRQFWLVCDQCEEIMALELAVDA